MNFIKNGMWNCRISDFFKSQPKTISLLE